LNSFLIEETKRKCNQILGYLRQFADPIRRLAASSSTDSVIQQYLRIALQLLSTPNPELAAQHLVPLRATELFILTSMRVPVERAVCFVCVY